MPRGPTIFDQSVITTSHESANIIPRPRHVTRGFAVADTPMEEKPHQPAGIGLPGDRANRPAALNAAVFGDPHQATGLSVCVHNAVRLAVPDGPPPHVTHRPAYQIRSGNGSGNMALRDRAKRNPGQASNISAASDTSLLDNQISDNATLRYGPEKAHGILIPHFNHNAAQHMPAAVQRATETIFRRWRPSHRRSRSHRRQCRALEVQIGGNPEMPIPMLRRIDQFHPIGDGRDQERGTVYPFAAAITGRIRRLCRAARQTNNCRQERKRSVDLASPVFHFVALQATHTRSSMTCTVISTKISNSE
jgi:hypothetical protein